MKSYKVETEFGTFTRKSASNRVYTHVVVARYSPAHQQKRILEAERHCDYIREVIRTQPADAQGFHWTNGGAGYNQKALDQANAGLEQARQHANDYFAATWCGRPDLAVKEQAKYRKHTAYYSDVRIVEVK